MSIALIDYGAGNLTSVKKAFREVGADIIVAESPAALSTADGIVVPGVGHFDATGSLGDAWRNEIRAAVDQGTPLLGICLGLQWLFDGSEEAPAIPGFGAFAGQCALLKGDLKVPHVGWNQLALTGVDSPLFAGVDSGAWAYFTHSYAAPVIEDTVATTTHGRAFSAAVARDRIFGLQFHPEKSGTTGLHLLANFMHVVRESR